MAIEIVPLTIVFPSSMDMALPFIVLFIMFWFGIVQEEEIALSGSFPAKFVVKLPRIPTWNPKISIFSRMLQYLRTKHIWLSFFMFSRVSRHLFIVIVSLLPTTFILLLPTTTTTRQEHIYGHAIDLRVLIAYKGLCWYDWRFWHSCREPCYNNCSLV